VPWALEAPGDQGGGPGGQFVRRLHRALDFAQNAIRHALDLVPSRLSVIAFSVIIAIALYSLSAGYEQRAPHRALYVSAYRLVPS
jgi:hypothetical protein